MISDSIPVFLNGRPCRVPPGSTLAQLLVGANPELAHELEHGAAQATDARGLPVDPAAPLTAGAIVRVQRSARTGDAADA